MIGLHTRNKSTQQELALLLSDMGVESYQPDHTYTHLLWLDSGPTPAGIPLLSPDKACFPMSLQEWMSFLQKSTQTTGIYDNAYFHFDGQKRLLLHKRMHKAFSLTEKENALLIFLSNAPDHTASRSKILQAVWQYSPQAQTHTLESHIYALKQKIGKDAENLIVGSANGYTLVS